ncbi:MAG: hypothetical protein AMXMBFR6_14580 [Betaproteobacteria bacterium]|jgi:PqqD family protein of HPr-rel-A system|nr:HPr-rel-A system PqqD family peptide chaperone [Rhodocyclaceae bacterium]MCG3186905.1 hypothetical protein [Rhodocyclaceae bacterium]
MMSPDSAPDPAPRAPVVDTLPGGALLRRLGSGAALFNPLSWETHLLDAAATELTLALREHAAGAPLARAEFESIWSEEPAVRVSLEALLPTLLEIGMVVDARPSVEVEGAAGVVA